MADVGLIHTSVSVTSEIDQVQLLDLNRQVVGAARQVSKKYALGGETRWVLQEVNLEIHGGECVFLTGPSGSGKSTLLSILGCLLTPDMGDVTIGGKCVSHLSAFEQSLLRREQIGFVFQKFQLIRGLTAEENVALALSLRGFDSKTAIRQAGEMLATVGLWEHRQSFTNRMSPGQCQRVAIARAIIGRPKLVLADEPTAALDSESGQDVMQLLRRLIRKTGAAALVVTHDPRILGFADRVCRIENGILV